jgi:hypothetical protein
MEMQINGDGYAIVNAAVRKSHRKTISREDIVNLADACMQRLVVSRNTAQNAENQRQGFTRFGAG